jgi:EmrB/QacA subfamily drug resistance transporter
MPQQLSDIPPSQREIGTVIIGLMLALMLASLDQNIVGVALPRIVSDLGGLSHLSWVVTAFLLTSTAATPLYGKLSDIYGRKPLFIAAIAIFLIGSSLCGLSGSMTQLIVFRGIQGLGAGGLMTLAMTTVADLVPPRERGRYQGYFGAVFALSSIAGPLLGGLITDALSWRWIFYVNLPLGALALAFFMFGFHRPLNAVSHRIDYAGAALLTAATVALLMALTWGGVQYAWSSPLIMGLAASVVMLCALLVRTERRAEEPVLAPHILKNRVFLIATGVMSLTFMGLFGAAVFLPLFFQLVLGFTPARAGLMLAPMTGGVVVASFLGGRLVSRTGRYKIFPVVGLAAATLAFLAVMCASVTGAGMGFIEISLVILGAGFGLVMPNLMVAIQNAVLPVELGSATAASAFFRSLGGALGVAISGAVMTARLQGLHAEKWTGMAKGARPLFEQGIQQIERLPPAQKEIVVNAYRQAIGAAFLLGSLVIALAFVLVLFLPEHPLRTSHAAPVRE